MCHGFERSAWTVSAGLPQRPAARRCGGAEAPAPLSRCAGNIRCAFAATRPARARQTLAKAAPVCYNVPRKCLDALAPWRSIEVVITSATRKFSKKCQFCPLRIQCFCELPQFEKPNILQFFPSVLSKRFGNDFRIDIWRVVRVVEGAALEMVDQTVRFVHPKIQP